VAVDKVGTIRADGVDRLEPDEFRRIIRACASPGVLKSGDLNVSQNGTPNLSVNVAAGEALIEGSTAGQGLYYFRNPSTLNVPVTQTSIVVARIYDSDYSGSTDTGTIEAVAGSTAPANSLPLAQVTVSGSTIVNANISGQRYRTTWVEHKYLVNDEVDTPVLGTMNLFTGTIEKPVGWVEYDLHVHGKIVWYAQNALNDFSRMTTESQVPTGTTRNEGRVSIPGDATGVSVYVTDPIDVVVNGLTANTTFTYRATTTLGGGNLFRRLIIATMTRLR